jgi:hypothetical protein
MILYNVTVKVDWAIHDAWLEWMRKEHMPEVVATGCFIRSYLFRILETDETEGLTYSSQYFAESKSDYNRYIELYAATMRQKAFDKWGERFIAFRSVMEVVK